MKRADVEKRFPGLYFERAEEEFVNQLLCSLPLDYKKNLLLFVTENLKSTTDYEAERDSVKLPEGYTLKDRTDGAANPNTIIASSERFDGYTVWCAEDGWWNFITTDYEDPGITKEEGIRKSIETLHEALNK